MIDEETIDLWFTYHPPTPELVVRYTMLRETFESCWTVIEACIRGGEEIENSQNRFTMITDSTKTLARVVNSTCPDGADKSAAIRCIRLARMAANEAVNARAEGDQSTWMMCERMSEAELIKARWQANAAIAIGSAA